MGEKVAEEPQLKIYGKMEHNYHLSSKKCLFHNLRIYYLARGLELWDVVPETFHVEHGVHDLAIVDFEKRYNAVQKEINLK
jgi:hypothetical protein